MAAPQSSSEVPPGNFPALSTARPIDGNLGGAPNNTGSGKPGAEHLQGMQSPSLTVEQSAPEEVQVGKPATFEIRVRNVGQVTAHDVEVREEIPQGAQLISSNPRANRGQNGELIWSVGTLKSGEEAKVRLELMPTSEGELGSVAKVSFAAEASVRTVSTRPELRIEAVSAAGSADRPKDASEDPHLQSWHGRGDRRDPFRATRRRTWLTRPGPNWNTTSAT